MPTIEDLLAQISALTKQINSLQKELVKSGKDESLKKGSHFLKKYPDENDKTKLRIILDTSWLVAIIDEKDFHHTSVNSSLGALLPYHPLFYVPTVVFMEAMSRLIRVNKISVSKARKTILKLLGVELHAIHESNMNYRDILEKYKTYSRIKIKSLKAIDFYIVTAGIGFNAKILTCDLPMYKSVKKYYKEIYFISDEVEAKESDLARLIHDIQFHKKV